MARLSSLLWQFHIRWLDQIARKSAFVASAKAAASRTAIKSSSDRGSLRCARTIETIFIAVCYPLFARGQGVMVKTKPCFFIAGKY